MSKTRLMSHCLDIKNVFGFLLPIKIRILREQIIRGGRFSIADLWERSVIRQGKRCALIFDGREYSYREMDDRVRRAASHLIGAKLPPRATVAIFGENHPSFWWYALAALGLGYVLIPLRPGNGGPLGRSLAAFEKIDCLLLSGEESVFDKGEATDCVGVCIRIQLSESFNDSFPVLDTEAMRAMRRDVRLTDVAMILQTSGTTGYPKACLAFHGMLLAYIEAHRLLKRLDRNDRSINCTNVSHGQGFFSGCMIQWSVGGSVVLEPNFDADRYFEICRKNGVTVVGYCGTLPRKLLGTKPSVADRQHRIRIAAGHEMSSNCRREFKDRFAIPVIAEYFASTEGSFFFGVRNHVNAVGFAGTLSRLVHPFAILRLDDDNELAMEGKRVVRCKTGEAGELVTSISDTDPLSFSRYLEPTTESESKLTNLFKTGDRWFRTGDIISIDEYGFLHFHGKRKSTVRVDGIYINPSSIEDELIAKLSELNGITDFLCSFSTRTGGERVLTMRVCGHGDQAKLRILLEREMENLNIPIEIRFEKDGYAETVSYRKIRSQA